MELQVKNGLFRYGHRDPVLKGVSFRFGDGTGSGRILAVLGPNGAGKTTLIRLLLGHLRWTEGETLFGGRKEPFPGRTRASDRLRAAGQSTAFRGHRA